jgi:hypothetical protein
MDRGKDQRRRRRRCREWLARYGPAEAGAVVGTLVGLTVAEPLGLVASAYAGAIGDGIGFYGVLLARDLLRQPKGKRARSLPAVVGALTLECGPAELLDSFVSRPFAIYLATSLLGATVAGGLAGKIAADIVFYAAAITAFELRRYRATRRQVLQRSSGAS